MGSAMAKIDYNFDLGNPRPRHGAEWERKVRIALLFGIVTVITGIVIYAIILKKRIPKNMEDLMVIPDDFGVSDDERLDLTIDRLEEVVTVSERVKSFCDMRGLDDRRSYLASLFLEEMAGNVVEHGFSKDKKDHTVDIRVVHKGDEMILRIKDDCKPFDPVGMEKLLIRLILLIVN